MPTIRLHQKNYEVGPGYNLSTFEPPFTLRGYDKVYVVAHDTDVNKGGWVIPAPNTTDGADAWVAVRICGDITWRHTRPGDGAANTLRNAVLVAQFEPPRVRGGLRHCINYLSNPIERR